MPKSSAGQGLTGARHLSFRLAADERGFEYLFPLAPDEDLWGIWCEGMKAGGSAIPSRSEIRPTGYQWFSKGDRKGKQVL